MKDRGGGYGESHPELPTDLSNALLSGGVSKEGSVSSQGHGTCFEAEGLNPRRKPHWPSAEDVEDESSAKALLDRTFDAMLEALSHPEPETERSTPPKTWTVLPLGVN